MAESQACDQSKQLKHSRPVEVDEDEVDDEEEVNADLHGRSTGSVLLSYVPEGMVHQQQQSKKQKPKPKKQQPQHNPHCSAKIQKKLPCKGGFTDCDILSPYLKKAVIADVENPLLQAPKASLRDAQASSCIERSETAVNCLSSLGPLA